MADMTEKTYYAKLADNEKSSNPSKTGVPIIYTIKRREYRQANGETSPPAFEVVPGSTINQSLNATEVRALISALEAALIGQ